MRSVMQASGGSTSNCVLPTYQTLFVNSNTNIRFQCLTLLLFLTSLLKPWPFNPPNFKQRIKSNDSTGCLIRRVPCVRLYFFFSPSLSFSLFKFSISKILLFSNLEFHRIFREWSEFLYMRTVLVISLLVILEFPKIMCNSVEDFLNSLQVFRL